MSENYLLGIDIGSSSVKAALLSTSSGEIVASVTSPDTELPIIAQKPGWAEQDPEVWWEHFKNCLLKIRNKNGIDLKKILAIGISYQMHGLVMVDKEQKLLAPSIIWCDSRAVDIGANAFKEIGQEKCLQRLLNSPGNFTASKLKWVMDNKPDIYKKIDKIMLPGDYIAMKLIGKINTTQSGLSEGILWDYQDNNLATLILDYYGIKGDLIPKTVGTFSIQGEVLSNVANDLGLKSGTLISYRAGDQPNNALSLNVLNPGEIAATAGTSGVIYGVGDKANYDPQSRVNTFVHVNSDIKKPRYGILLCINGTGSLNSWVRNNFFKHYNTFLSYNDINQIAMEAPPGADGLMILPYGNGAERSLQNKNIKCQMHGLEFNRHTKSHFLRAVQEGIVCSLNYGLEIMKQMGISVHKVRAGYANMFLSPLFCQTFADITGAEVELYNTDGAAGAARGAGIGAGIYHSFDEAFASLKTIKSIKPDPTNAGISLQLYQAWLDVLNKSLI